MILVVSPHNRSVSDLSISFRVCCEGLLQYSKRFKSKKPTVRIRLTWNSIGWYQISICTIAWSWIFRFSSRGRAYLNLLIDSQSAIFIRSSWNLVGWYETSVRTIFWSRIFWFPLRKFCWGVPLAIFKSIHSLHFSFDWAVGWYKTSVRTIVCRRIFRFTLALWGRACLNL